MCKCQMENVRQVWLPVKVTTLGLEPISKIYEALSDKRYVLMMSHKNRTIDDVSRFYILSHTKIFKTDHLIGFEELCVCLAIYFKCV